MEFTVEERSGHLIAKFSIYHDIRDWLLFAFLDQAASPLGAKDCWDGIKISENNQNLEYDENCILHQFTSDNIHTAFYQDRIEIEELFPEDEDNPACVLLSISDAKTILYKWGKEITRRESRKD
jgi:hypothetical protein